MCLCHMTTLNHGGDFKKSALGCGLYHRVIYWKMLTGELVTNDETPTVIRDNLLT